VKRAAAAAAALVAPLALAAVVLLAPLAALSGALASPLTPSTAALSDIPAQLLPIYQQAAGRCTLPWTVLAGVGKVETDHARSTLPGVASGANAAGAAGPMQFGIGGRAGNTWGGTPVRAVPPDLRFGVDGNGDGTADVYDPADAIHAAAGYLCHLGADTDLRTAVASYNAGPGNPAAGMGYADRVLAIADGYAQPAAPQPASGPGAWGDHANGRIPADALCPIDPAGQQRLRCDAAAAFAQMDAAYRARFASGISITDSYRSFDDQVRLKASWCDRGACNMAAEPGTSNHGWGLALDLGGGINSFGTAEHEWMQANAPAFGWHHPHWARRGGGKQEPWHWEYGTGAER